MGATSILDRLSALDTNTVSDALGFLGLKGATYGLRPLWDCPKIVGRASTVKVGPKTDAASTTHLLTSVIDRVKINDCGIRGTIIDGMSRDIGGSREVGYSVYGWGVTMISARNRVVQLDSGTPLQMRGVTVHQDDYVIADRCGTVLVPAARIEKVFHLAERIDRSQARMVQAVREGHAVSEVMHDSQFKAIREIAPAQTPAAAVPAPGHNPKSASCEDQELVALFAESGSPVGPAFKVRYFPASDPPGSVGDFIDDVAVGDFVVIGNGGRTDCTVWGDIITQYAALRGISGAVIDGVCRDVNRAISDSRSNLGLLKLCHRI
ncbi:RraA-like protein [Aspergillus homomorphus CBS 101889]|uniref:RraA-like protein n=1 Tax=Aspergillus homomorphus (strain CBS 101889) TaxID=1450537 RepID=A0A395HNA8_ASPHC|nr:RraA-like protein [Aspergillus homomorphus CBS 101889]RAL09411.1 RraA-like protein [Aspergillus homomorphus CBS 101889]